MMEEVASELGRRTGWSVEVGHRRSREITRERGRRWEKVKEGGPRVWVGLGVAPS